MISYSHRILHHKLNLDYDKKGNYVTQTDNTLNQVMNIFIRDNKKYFKDYLFVLYFNDDICSLITYNILKNIQSVYPFNLKVYYCCTKNTFNKYVSDTDKINKIKYITKKKKIIINPYNPILNFYYPKNKVTKLKKIFNKMSNQIKVIDRFTPQQLQILSDFFNIKDTSLLSIFTKDNVQDYIKFCNYDDTVNLDNLASALNCSIGTYPIKKYSLNGNESDFPLYEEILSYDNEYIIFYSCKQEAIPFIQVNLNSYISSRNALIPDYNVNIEEES